MKKVIWYLLLVSIVFGYGSFTYGRGDDYPKPQGYVSDYAGIISAEYEGYLERLALEIEEKVGIQVAVVSVKSLEGESVEGYAVALFEDWGIGKKGKDDGLLLLVAPKERKVRIETGYGLEGFLPDSLCGMIIDRIMIPCFKKGDYNQGVTAAMVYIAKIIEKEYKVKISLDSPEINISQPRHGETRGRSIIGMLFSLLFFMLLLGSRTGLLGFLLLGFLGSSGYWRSGGYYGGSGGFSGGFGGFGGGSSGGGGASGSW